MTKIRKFSKWPGVVRVCRAGSPGPRRSFFRRKSRSWRREMVETVLDLTVGHHGARGACQEGRQEGAGRGANVQAVSARVRGRAVASRTRK